MHISVEPGILLKCKGDYESAVKFLESRQRALEIIDDIDDEDDVIYLIFFIYVKI